MGETRTPFKIYGMDGEAAELEAVVDTGATFTKIPIALASALGLQAKYETDVELGDGRIITRGLALAEVEIVTARSCGSLNKPPFISMEQDLAVRGGEEAGSRCRWRGEAPHRLHHP